MEAVFLLMSMAATFLTSSFLSLLLLLRLLLHRRSPATGDQVRLYEGRVRHARRRPAPHSFEYPVRYALVDLDRFPLPGHLSAAAARDVAGAAGPVLLLTILKSVGYEQNPLSIYYCYDLEQEQEQDGGGAKRPTHLKMCIAEVTNTPWGERVMFTFQPNSDLVAKPLHVSPFMDMLGNWTINADEPGEGLSVAISVQHPTLGNYFTATLQANLVGSKSDSLRLATFFWLMPHKVAAWIYWEALRLWLKNVKFLDHPRYINQNYRDEALQRDLEIRGCCNFARSMSISSIDSNGESRKSNHSDSTSNGNNRSRWCVWRDARWPWA